MSNVLLLYSSRPEDEAFAKEISQIAGLQYTCTKDTDETLKYYLENPVEALIIDASSEQRFLDFQKKLEDTVGLFSEKVNPNRFHFLCSEELDSSKYLTESVLFGNFIIRKFKDEKSAVDMAKRYAHALKATLMERSFGLKNFFSDKSQIQNLVIKKSSQKQQVVEAIRGYLLKAKYPSRMANVIANAVDELIMNAIFTAPVDELGKRLFDQTPRDTEMELKDKQAVEVTVAFDGNQVGVSATDHYGAIDKSKLIKHLSTIYTDETYKIRSSTVSAGIGLATTFKSGGSLIFICEKSQKTEVAVVFERYSSYREFKDQFRYISLQFYL